MSAQNRRALFMTSVMTMLVSQLMVKLTGLLYRLVITNIPGFGDAGNGFYTAGFQLYTLLLAISSVGIPNAISKLISAETARGDRGEADRIFRVALVLFLGIGVLCSLFLFFGADFIALHVLKMNGVQSTLRALSPSVTFVCVSSVIRGYFLGLGDVKATSRSQVLEQVFKSTLTILFVLALTAYSAQVMSAGANFATTVATAISMCYLVGFYCRRKPPALPGTPRWTGGDQAPTMGSLCKKILAVSLPISFGSIIIAIGRVVDTATITRGIAAAFAGGIPGTAGLPTAADLNAEAVRLAGMLSKSDSLINLPLALNIAFATVLVPTLSSALATGRRNEAEEKISFSLLISVLLIFPCAMGLAVLAHPIYQLLYPHAPQGWQLLQISALSLLFMALGQTINGSLQGLGKVSIPARSLLYGVTAKVILNNILIRIPSINIYGAAIGSVFCYLISCSLCFYHLRKAFPMTLSAGRCFWKPLFCTGVMGAVAGLGYPLLVRLFQSNALALLVTIAGAGFVYLLLVLTTGILTEADLAQLPLSDRMRDRLEKYLS